MMTGKAERPTRQSSIPDRASAGRPGDHVSPALTSSLSARGASGYGEQHLDIHSVEKTSASLRWFIRDLRYSD